jgi:hypothetical protein
MSADDVDPERLVEFANGHAERAVESTNAANPDREVETVNDLYEMVSGVEEMQTYEVEIELHDFEMMQLMAFLMDGLERVQSADELAFKSNMIAKLVDAAPEHLTHMDELREDFEEPRGFQ